MGLRGRLLVFGYPALELLTAWGLMQWLGWEWTLVIFLAGVPVGFVLMRAAGRNAMAELQRSAGTGMAPQRMGDHGAWFAAGLLLALPGVWSDLAALFIWFRPSRRWMVNRGLGGWMPVQGQAWSVRRWGTAPWSDNSIWPDPAMTVIPGEVIRPERGRGSAEGSASQSPADPPGGGGPAGAIER